MKKINYLLITGLIILSFACKDRKRAMALEGTWLEVKIDGTSISPSAADRMTFGACKNKKKTYCELTLSDASSSYTETYGFKIDDKGETLIIKESYGIIVFNKNCKILTYTDNYMTIDWGDFVGEYQRQ